jgi:hypothetical protein
MLLGRQDTTTRFIAFMIIVGDIFFVVSWSILISFFDSGLGNFIAFCVLVYVVQLGMDLCFFFMVCKEARFVRIAEGEKGFEKYTVKLNFGGKQDVERGRD